MIHKSALRTVITEKLEEYEIDDRDLVEDLLETIAQEFGDDVYDDDDEDYEDYEGDED
jgi:hypothetical protein